MLERTGHTYLLTCGARGDTRAPTQPMGAVLEACLPASFLVELTDQYQEPVGGRIDVGGEFGDLIAQPHDLSQWVGSGSHGGDWGGRGGRGGGGGCGL